MNQELQTCIFPCFLFLFISLHRCPSTPPVPQRTGKKLQFLNASHCVLIDGKDAGSKMLILMKCLPKCYHTIAARKLGKLLDVSNWKPKMIYDRYADCCGRNIYPIWIPNLAFVQNVDPKHLSLTWSVSMMSARSFSDILRMEAAMDLALIIDLAERPPFAATAPACFNLLLLINCCLTSWTSKSISLARAWWGWRRRNEKKRGGWWNGYWKNKGDSSASQMNKWNWSSMRQRGLVHYEGILSLTQSDSLRFRLKLPCRNVDLRVCFSVDW